MTAQDDRLARYVEQLERLRDVPSPERDERLRALIVGIPPEDREAFHALAAQKRAHYGEMVEHDAERLREARAAEPAPEDETPD